MIDFTIRCPECNKESDNGKVQVDIETGRLRVECGWCHVAWMLEAPITSPPIITSRRDYMPYWKQKILGIYQGS